ncbi:MAG: TatD family hydrolase [Smithellaceae bacterium]|nr:TatD family hydrolase [Syntrophaceae bacterium]MDD4241015.1 TatD family hydrolase [Smithellaceae bacterium]NLX53048.1 TatD family hydrolase [Deltaproteobacteria bacterium]
MLIDSHAHLEMEPFDADREAVIERAGLAGVECIITVGTSPVLSRKAVSLARRYENIYATVGIHPHDADAAGEHALDELKALAADPKVVAYGEIGLDFFRNLSPRKQQTDMFARQLELAGELNLPVVIHDREAHEETLALIRASGIRRGVFHCFSGDWTMARQCLDLGFYLSVPGVVTFEKSHTLREVVRQAPLERLLLETDCPYLAPVPHRGQRNEPAFIVHTAKKVARIKDRDWEDVARTASENTRTLFRLGAQAK